MGGEFERRLGRLEIRDLLINAMLPNYLLLFDSGFDHAALLWNSPEADQELPSDSKIGIYANAIS